MATIEELETESKLLGQELRKLPKITNEFKAKVQAFLRKAAGKHADNTESISKTSNDVKIRYLQAENSRISPLISRWKQL